MHHPNEPNTEESDALEDQAVFSDFTEDLFAELMAEDENEKNEPTMPSILGPNVDDPFRALENSYIEHEVYENYRMYNYSRFKANVDPDYVFELKNVSSNHSKNYVLAYCTPQYIQQITHNTNINKYSCSEPEIVGWINKSVFGNFTERVNSVITPKLFPPSYLSHVTAPVDISI